jgi:hypothetical protein
MHGRPTDGDSLRGAVAGSFSCRTTGAAGRPDFPPVDLLLTRSTAKAKCGLLSSCSPSHSLGLTSHFFPTSAGPGTGRSAKLPEGRAMQRWIVNTVIAGYLVAMAFGLLCVACQVQFFSVPAYFFTFNMYGGWCGYDARMQVIGEGESGRFYTLSPGPWGEFDPYSSHVPRQSYDQAFEYGSILARPALAHTKHEPILRIFVIEQEYPKKFNLTDAQFEAYYNKPKPQRIYSHVRMALSPQGEIITQNSTWLRYQDNQALVDNPRLVAEATRNRPFIWSAQQAPGPGGSSSELYAPLPLLERMGSPVAE